MSQDKLTVKNGDNLIEGPGPEVRKFVKEQNNHQLKMKVIDKLLSLFDMIKVGILKYFLN